MSANEDSIQPLELSLPDYIETFGEKIGVPKSLRDAIFQNESNFEHYDSNGRVKISSAGARGVGQLMPGTAKQLGVDPDDPIQNAYGSLKLQKQLYDKYLAAQGDEHQAAILAASAYNAGEGAVDKYNGVPQYKETQNYVRKVAKHLRNHPIKAPRVLSTASEAPIAAPPVVEAPGIASVIEPDGAVLPKKAAEVPLPGFRGTFGAQQPATSPSKAVLPLSSEVRTDEFAPAGPEIYAAQQKPSQIDTVLNAAVQRLQQNNAETRRRRELQARVERARQVLAKSQPQTISKADLEREAYGTAQSRELEAYGRRNYPFAGARVASEGAPKQTSLGESFTAFPGMHQIAKLLPKEERENIAEGTVSGLANTVRQAAGALQYHPGLWGLAQTERGKEVLAKVRGAAKEIDKLVAENEEARPAPTSIAGEIRRGVGKGVGTAAVELPKLILGGQVLGAANLPVQGALSRSEEGAPGIVKGVAGGLVYHYGGQATGSLISKIAGPYLAKLGNTLVWVAGPVAEQQAIAAYTGEQAPNLARSIGENIPFGIIAGAGAKGRNRTEPVQVREGETVRPATEADLPKIISKELEVVPPAVKEAQQRIAEHEAAQVSRETSPAYKGDERRGTGRPSEEDFFAMTPEEQQALRQSLEAEMGPATHEEGKPIVPRPAPTEVEPAPTAAETPLPEAVSGAASTPAKPVEAKPAEVAGKHPTIYLADSVNGGFVEKPVTYIRFGDLPKGRSGKYRGAERYGEEEGVSVYAAWKDPRTGKYVLYAPGDPDVATLDNMIGEEAPHRRRKIYEVKGEEVGTGSDEERLIKEGSGRVVREIDPDEIVTDSEPRITFKGTELEGDAIPDWTLPESVGRNDVIGTMPGAVEKAGSRGASGQIPAEVAGESVRPPTKTKLDLVLDAVESKKREVTLDVRDYTEADKQRIIDTAKARGLDAASDGNHILVRDLRDAKPVDLAAKVVTSRGEVIEPRANNTFPDDHPNVETLSYPAKKSDKSSAAVRILNTGDGWVYGVDVALAQGGMGRPMAAETKFGSREDAIRSGLREVYQTAKVEAENPQTSENQQEQARDVQRWAFEQYDALAPKEPAKVVTPESEVIPSKIERRGEIPDETLNKAVGNVFSEGEGAVSAAPAPAKPAFEEVAKAFTLPLMDPVKDVRKLSKTIEVTYESESGRQLTRKMTVEKRQKQLEKKQDAVSRLLKCLHA